MHLVLRTRSEWLPVSDEEVAAAMAEAVPVPQEDDGTPKNDELKIDMIVNQRGEAEDAQAEAM